MDAGEEESGVAEMDVIFANGLVVDGTGAPAFRADVGVAGGRIRRIGRLGEARAARVVDIEGMMLCPGFVDMHAHSDAQLLANPRAEAKTMQGVTTEVIGHDGLSFAPVDARTLEAVREQTLAWNGVRDEISWDWSSVAQYLARFDRQTSVNVAYLVPHGTVRILAMGYHDRRPTAAELGEMRRHVRQGMEEGAVGLSTGLMYAPAVFAEADEMAALCEEIAPFGGFFAPHHRSYGKGALESYREMIEVARRARVPVHFTHCVLQFPANAGRAGELIAMFDALDPSEVEVTVDSYPYLPGNTYLAALLPPWIGAEGPKGVLAALRDEERTARCRREMEVEGTPGYQGMPVDWTTVQISSVSSPRNQRWVGKRISEIAAAQGIESFEAARRLLLEERLDVNALIHIGNEDNVRAIMQLPYHMAGSDGILVGGKPHPRGWGTFARYLGYCARDEGMFSWPEIVRKMTSLPQRRLGQWDRGIIRPGMWADIVVFDPDAVRDTATFEDPRRFPEGIPYVMVNGTLVKDDGVHTGALPGMALRGRGAARR